MDTKIAVVTGATGQDARYLVPELRTRGYEVHAFVHDASAAQRIYGADEHVVVRRFDLQGETIAAARAIAELKPDVIFNLAGQSSVHRSFEQPALSWSLNADWPLAVLEAIRRDTPRTRLYQASSSEMFGCLPGEAVVHDETSAFRPQSPYAASKAAAHLACGVYRESFGLAVACGILFNHESRHRGEAFVTTKIVRHVRALRAMTPAARETAPPLRVGRLDVQRDWGFAAEYVRGILLIADQLAVRNDGGGYRDYVLGTGVLTSVRDLIDRAFALGGFALDWSDDCARFRGTNRDAVQSVPELVRAAEPKAIQANPQRALDELGWKATPDIDLFLRDMLQADEVSD